MTADAERAFGVVVGRLDAAVVGERPERGPDFQQVAGEPARVLVARRFAGVFAEDRFQLAAQQPDPAPEFFAVAGCAGRSPRTRTARRRSAGRARRTPSLAASPSAWAWKSRRRCAQQTWRRASGRWLYAHQRSEVTIAALSASSSRAWSSCRSSVDPQHGVPVGERAPQRPLAGLAAASRSRPCSTLFERCGPGRADPRRGPRARRRRARGSRRPCRC